MKRTKKDTPKTNAWHPDQLTVTDAVYLDKYSSEAFLVVNKNMLRYLGAHPTLLLSSLIDKFRYYKNNDQLVDGKWFYFTRPEQMKQLGMTEHFIEKARKKLEEIGVVRTELKGLPAKLHWRIDTNQLKQMAETSIQRSSKQVSSDHRSKYTAIIETSIQRSSKQVSSDHGSNSSINTTKNKNRDNKNRDNDIKKYTKSEKERLLDEIKETPSQKKIRVQEEFDVFWEVYPRKTAKKPANEKWINLFLNSKKSETPTFAEVIQGIKKQAPILSKREPKYIPHPTTWLNQRRWDDKLEDIGGGDEKSNRPSSGHYEPDYEFSKEDGTI